MRELTLTCRLDCAFMPVMRPLVPQPLTRCNCLDSSGCHWHQDSFSSSLPLLGRYLVVFAMCREKIEHRKLRKPNFAAWASDKPLPTWAKHRTRCGSISATAQRSALISVTNNPFHFYNSLKFRSKNAWNILCIYLFIYVQNMRPVEAFLSEIFEVTEQLWPKIGGRHGCQWRLVA